uniref:Uncharacterized protein n=1 Tax=Timema genevievae TaxID=629358 RepID=A0A7R9JS27_TIMGE|nr:unnamed protein product [Timema genevievae]
MTLSMGQILDSSVSWKGYPGKAMAPKELCNKKHSSRLRYKQIQDPGTLWILYNDQPPNGGVEIELGHTKGVVMSQSNGGFWLIHSVPHYPPSPNKSTHYSYPHTGLHYGQSLMCISLDVKQLDTVGIQLMYNEPEIYSVNTLGVLRNLFPNLMAAANNTRVQSAPWFRQAQINSLQGTKFSSFAKASHFHKDLYADWVAATLETDLVVESWTNGVGPLPSECSKQFKVENIESVNVKVAAANFSSHLDHSKWALSVDNHTKSWVCVGDINRMTSQEERGGGTVCINNAKLWSAYRGVVARPNEHKNKNDDVKTPAKSNIDTTAKQNDSVKTSAKSNIDTRAKQNDTVKTSDKSNMNTTAKQNDTVKTSDKANMNTTAKQNDTVKTSAKANMNTTAKQNDIVKTSAKANMNTTAKQNDTVKTSDKAIMNTTAKQNDTVKTSDKANIDTTAKQNNIVKTSDKANMNTTAKQNDTVKISDKANMNTTAKQNDTVKTSDKANIDTTAKQNDTVKTSDKANIDTTAKQNDTVKTSAKSNIDTRAKQNDTVKTSDKSNIDTTAKQNDSSQLKAKSVANNPEHSNALKEKQVSDTEKTLKLTDSHDNKDKSMENVPVITSETKIEQGSNISNLKNNQVTETEKQNHKTPVSDEPKKTANCSLKGHKMISNSNLKDSTNNSKKGNKNSSDQKNKVPLESPDGNEKENMKTDGSSKITAAKSRCDVCSGLPTLTPKVKSDLENKAIQMTEKCAKDKSRVKQLEDKIKKWERERKETESKAETKKVSQDTSLENKVKENTSKASKSIPKIDCTQVKGLTNIVKDSLEKGDIQPKISCEMHVSLARVASQWKGGGLVRTASQSAHKIVASLFDNTKKGSVRRNRLTGWLALIPVDSVTQLYVKKKPSPCLRVITSQRHRRALNKPRTESPAMSSRSEPRSQPRLRRDKTNKQHCAQTKESRKLGTMSIMTRAELHSHHHFRVSPHFLFTNESQFPVARHVIQTPVDMNPATVGVRVSTQVPIVWLARIPHKAITESPMAVITMIDLSSR